MSTVQEQYDAFQAKLNAMKLTPDAPGYLLSMDFLKQFKSGAQKDSPPSQIKNASLRRKKELKPNMVRGEDYIVVDYEIWTFLHGLFKGGPEIPVPILESGEPELYPTRIHVKTDRGPREFRVSLKMDMKTFEAMLTDAMKLPKGTPLHIAAEMDGNIVYGSEGTLETVLKGETRLCVRPDFGGAKPEPKEEPQPKMAMGKGKKGKRGKRGRNAEAKKEQLVRSMGKFDAEKPFGLQNYGNTCYMNASLQCLMSLPSFMGRLDELVEKCPKEDQVCSEFARFTEYQDPRIVKRVVGERIPMFKGKDQQDAHEFVTFFLDMLHDESPTVMDSLFYGKLESVTKCTHCGEQVRRPENFSILSLPLSSARRITVVPYDNTKNLEKRVDIPEDVQCLSLGIRSANFEVIQQDSYRYQEVLSLELPKTYEPDSMFSLLFLKVRQQKGMIGVPILLARKSGEENLEDAVWERIENMWGREAEVTLSVKTKGEYERDPAAKSVPFCKQRVIACVDQADVRRNSGFRNRETDEEDLTLSDLINAFFKNSQLDSHNQWQCEKCSQKSCAHQEFRLVSVAENIIFHLKRFHVGETTTRDDSPVNIPSEIQLSTDTEEDITFELMAVANHSGDADWGHYTAVGKRNGNWYNFNDSHVSHSKSPARSSESAYVLFYSRQGATDKDE